MTYSFFLLKFYPFFIFKLLYAATLASGFFFDRIVYDCTFNISFLRIFSPFWLLFLSDCFTIDSYLSLFLQSSFSGYYVFINRVVTYHWPIHPLKSIISLLWECLPQYRVSPTAHLENIFHHYNIKKIANWDWMKHRLLVLHQLYCLFPALVHTKF